MNFEDIILSSVQQNVAEVISDCFQNQVLKDWAFGTDSPGHHILKTLTQPWDRSCGGELSLCPQPRLSLEMDPAVLQFSFHVRLSCLDCTLKSNPKSEPSSEGAPRFPHSQTLCRNNCLWF